MTLKKLIKDSIKGLQTIAKEQKAAREKQCQENIKYYALRKKELKLKRQAMQERDKIKKLNGGGMLGF